MRLTLVFGLALVACGGASGAGDTPAPTPAVVDSTGATEDVEPPIASDLGLAPDLPRAAPEALTEPQAAPLAMPGLTVPQVPAVLPPPPRDAVVVLATTTEARFGETTVSLAAGSLPTAQALTPIGEALAKTEGTVVVAVDAAVSAGVVRRVLELLPPERSRAVLARGADGTEGVLPLSTEMAHDAPVVSVAADGFHLAEKVGSPQLHLKPEAGDPFDYTGLRNKAKAFRTKHPEIDRVRVEAASEVSADVLLRALAQIRGPKCTPEPERCWLPGLVFGDTSRAAAPVGERPAIVLPHAGAKHGSPGSVTIGKATVPDALDADEVRKVLGSRAGYARMCYSAALADAPGLKGKMVLRLTVDANGEVDEVGVPSATLKSLAVEDCLERGVKGLRFSPPTKAPAMVDVPLTFSLETAAAK